MTIAISANIAPSRILLALTCAAVAAANLAVLWATVIAPFALLLKAAMLLLCLAASLFSLWRFWRARRPLQIEIGASGDVVLRAPAVLASRWRPAAQACVHKMTLAEQSTLWPRLLLLNLRSEDGSVFKVPVLPDSVPEATFLALTIAFRWIAIHHHSSRVEAPTK